jgi:hypothetical protein
MTKTELEKKYPFKSFEAEFVDPDEPDEIPF